MALLCFRKAPLSEERFGYRTLQLRELKMRAIPVFAPTRDNSSFANWDLIGGQRAPSLSSLFPGGRRRWCWENRCRNLKSKLKLQLPTPPN